MEIGRKPLGVFTLTMINVAAILSLRNLPLLSAYGWAMISLYGIVALAFFIPVSLISAELASMLPEEGGVYAWIREAIGSQPAFLCVWLSLITTVTALTMTLIFVSTALAFSLAPSLVGNHYYTATVTILVIWTATFLSLHGMKISGVVTALASILGTVIPGALIIGLGIWWFGTDHPLQLQFSWGGLLPNLDRFSNISFLAGAMFAFAGIEMSAYHVNDVNNPRRSYPRAIFYAALLILLLSILGSMAIALVIPKSQILLEAGVVQTITAMLEGLHWGWLAPGIGLLIAFGGIAFAFAWMAGPPRGLLATRATGDLPLFLQKTNTRGMPVNILYLQAIVVSAFSLLFLFLPSIGLGFWILNAVSAVMILILYFFIFGAGILLRYRLPNAPRPYKIPGGNGMMALLSLLGILNICFCFGVSFVLPTELRGQISPQGFAWIILIVVALLSCPPLLFHALRRPSWKANSPEKSVEME